VQTSPNVTFGSPDANGAPAKGAGTVIYKTVGSPGGVDDLDISMSTNIVDVRCLPAATSCGSANITGGADYVGEVETNVPFQITDHQSGVSGSGSDPSTMLQIDFPYETTCAATVDTTIGATCATTTSADALVAGAIPEGKRINVELDQATVWDGGPDGIVFTPDNSLLLVQGVFVP
jgi:hypothetical protein